MRIGDIVVPICGSVEGRKCVVTSCSLVPEWGTRLFYGVKPLDDEEDVVNHYFSRPFLDHVWLEADAL